VSNLAKFRAGLVFWLPGLLGALYVLTSPRPTQGNRLLAAGGTFLAVEVLVCLGFMLVDIAVLKLLGEKGAPDTADALFSRHGLTAALLAAAIWTWWHYDRDRTTERVADCVRDYQGEAGQMSPSSLILWCYDNPPEQPQATDNR
jgi:hypothetical protein